MALWKTTWLADHYEGRAREVPLPVPVSLLDRIVSAMKPVPRELAEGMSRAIDEKISPAPSGGEDTEEV